MTDIVDRLRNGTTDGTSLRWQVGPIHLEAAAEILSLRQQLDEALERNLLANERADNAVADMEKARAMALEEAARVVEGFQVPKSPNDGDLRPRKYPSQTSVAIAAAIRALAGKSADVEPVATHRHKKRGSFYATIGVGKMQSENWRELLGDQALEDGDEVGVSVDMRPVVIYRGLDDGSLWVRPLEEFEDGRFEPLYAGPEVTL